MTDKLNINNQKLKVEIIQNRILLKSLNSDINNLIKKKNEIILEIKKINGEYTSIKNQFEREAEKKYENVKLVIEKKYDDKIKDFESQYKNSENGYLLKIKNQKNKFNRELTLINKNHQNQVHKIKGKNKKELQRLIKKDKLRQKEMITKSIQTDKIKIKDFYKNISYEDKDIQTENNKNNQSKSIQTNQENSVLLYKEEKSSPTKIISKNYDKKTMYINYTMGYIPIYFKRKKTIKITKEYKSIISFNGILKNSFEINLLKNSCEYDEQSIFKFNYLLGKRNKNHNLISLNSKDYVENIKHSINNIRLCKTTFTITFDIKNYKLYFIIDNNEENIINLPKYIDFKNIDGVFSTMRNLKIMIKN